MNKIKETIDYYFNIICLALFICLLTGIIVLIYRSFSVKTVKSETTNQTIQSLKENTEEEKKQNDKIKVDVKGAIKNPGVYELENSSNVIDQTTPNMIQRISGIFERNPLISKEI